MSAEQKVRVFIFRKAVKLERAETDMDTVSGLARPGLKRSGGIVEKCENPTAYYLWELWSPEDDLGLQWVDASVPFETRPSTRWLPAAIATVMGRILDGISIEQQEAELIASGRVVPS